MAEPLDPPRPDAAANQATATFSAHYISGTHWDREWYRPVQEFRLLLVALIDELLDLMETSEDFRYFHLDGQTCVLQDYTEIRPENTERLAKLIRDGRILIGPWFTMPDLFCPGDEAMVRNLLLGRRLCGEWNAEPMPIAYTCDMFGHPSQMPQIYMGFGLRHCVLGRGTNEHTTPPFFRWSAPDGSTVFTFKLQDEQGYGAFAVPRGTLETKATFISQLMSTMQQELAACAGDAAKELEVRERWFRKKLSYYVEHEMARANGSTLCLMDSMDHIMPATEVARYLRLIREACPNVAPRHSTLPAFFADAEATARETPLRVGELREPAKNRVPYLYLIPNCVSARVQMKQANDQCQTLLERWAEPWTAIANLHGAGLPPRFLQVAWQHVLLNHAHDSICGCSIDQVHRDMMYRFDQARILAEQLRNRALGALTEGCADLATGPNEFTLVLANPSSIPRHETVVFDVDLPLDYPAAFREGFFPTETKAFTLSDADGNPVPYQRLAVIPRTNERSRYARPCFQSDGPFTRYTVAATVDLPGLGFTALRVAPAKLPVRPVGTLRTGPTAAANMYLSICIDPNGTLVLHHKASNTTYTDLLLLEDRSEVGDGWFHTDALNDEIHIGSGGTADISVAHDGPEMVSFRVRRRLRLPKYFDKATEAPSRELVDLEVSHLVSLRKGAQVVDVETTIDNNVEDHRLRLLLPTDAASARTWWAHHPYDFVDRDIAIDESTHDWQEMELAEKPFLHAQGVGDGNRGLAFLSAGGLHEGGVADDERRTLQITLLRSFRKTIATGDEIDGLEQGRLVHRYAILPYAGDTPRCTVMAELAVLQGGLLTRQTGIRPSGYPEMVGHTTPQLSYLTQHGIALALSTLKPAEDGDGLILRVWNPANIAATDRFTLWQTPESATVVSMAESVYAADAAPGEASLGSNVLTIRAPARSAVTVRLRFT